MYLLRVKKGNFEEIFEIVQFRFEGREKLYYNNFYYFELSLDFNPFMHECENLRKVTKPRINFRFRSKMFRWTTRGCIYAKMSRAKLPSNTGLSLKVKMTRFFTLRSIFWCSDLFFCMIWPFFEYRHLWLLNTYIKGGIVKNLIYNI